MDQWALDIEEQLDCQTGEKVKCRSLDNRGKYASKTINLTTANRGPCSRKLICTCWERIALRNKPTLPQWEGPVTGEGIKFLIIPSAGSLTKAFSTRNLTPGSVSQWKTLMNTRMGKGRGSTTPLCSHVTWRYLSYLPVRPVWLWGEGYFFLLYVPHTHNLSLLDVESRPIIVGWE